MIRVLIIIAVAGFVLALGSLSAAVAIGGPDALARGAWTFAGRDWRDHGDWDWDEKDGPAASGPQTTRTLAWTGGERLEVSVPAEVRYVQSNGPASVVVTGPADLVNRLELRGGDLRLEGRRHHRGWRMTRINVVVTAPGVSEFDLSGASKLAIENYDQPELRLDLSGATEVRAAGQTKSLQLEISGAGDADLAALKTVDAEVDISGAADATIAPSGKAEVEISGMGQVTLATEPSELQTRISGAGQITHAARETQTGASGDKT